MSEVKDKVNTFLALQQEMHELADAAANRYIEITGETDHGRDCVTEFNEDKITWEGDEYWGYGGHEHYSSSMPTRALWDETYWTNLQERVERDNRLREKKRQEKQQQQLARQEEKDREQLRRLKEKYE